MCFFASRSALTNIQSLHSSNSCGTRKDKRTEGEHSSTRQWSLIYELFCPTASRIPAVHLYYLRGRSSLAAQTLRNGIGEKQLLCMAPWSILYIDAMVSLWYCGGAWAALYPAPLFGKTFQDTSSIIFKILYVLVSILTQGLTFVSANWLNLQEFFKAQFFIATFSANSMEYWKN